MEPFSRHRGQLALLMRENVDTDQIIPKQFLKSIARTGYEKGLFYDWRFHADGSPNPHFALNQPRYQGASILVTGNNFGCGSSREHAVWAVVQYGFRVILAPHKGSIPAFADIFRSNSGKNGLLLVALSPEEIEKIVHHVEADEGLEATVDLEKNTIVWHRRQGDDTMIFAIDATTRRRLLAGLDDIGVTLTHAAEISAFEKQHGANFFGAVAQLPGVRGFKPPIR